jgi:SH3-like domain-containing protein
MLAAWTGAHAQGVQAGSSGLPIPRFVSLGSSAVNVRIGPSRNHAVAWTYVRSGLPVEVTQEFENWRRIRDWEGAEGWVLGSLLSGARTTLVAPWDTTGQARSVFAGPSETARVVAYVDPKVPASVESCDGTWCEIYASAFSGWIQQEMLWGVYPDEVID